MELDPLKAWDESMQWMPHRCHYCGRMIWPWQRGKQTQDEILWFHEEWEQCFLRVEAELHMNRDIRRD